MSGQRRVAFFDAYPQVAGGAHVVALDLASHLPAQGWDVDWILPGEGPLVGAVGRLADRISGVSARRVPAPAALSHFGGRTTGPRLLAALGSAPAFTIRLADALRESDVVYAIDPRGILLAGPAGRLVRRPVVWHLHMSSPWPLANRLGSAIATRTVVVSRQAALGSPGLGRYDVLVNPLVRRPGHVEPRRPGPALGCIARVHPEKGIDLLVEAAALLVADHPEVTLTIVATPQPGADAYRAQLDSLVAGLGLGDRVTFLERVDDPWVALAHCSLYVQPSRREGFGLAALEAMAHGFCVVMTDTDGGRELIDDGRNGLLVGLDAASVARGVSELVDDPVRGLALAGDAIAFAARFDDGPAYAARWAGLFDQIVR